MLENSDVKIRNDIKHHVNKIKKANENISQLKQRKDQLIKEHSQSEKQLPDKINKQEVVAKKKAEAEKKFESLEMKVREFTEQLRKEKEQEEQKLNPLLNQFQ